MSNIKVPFFSASKENQLIKQEVLDKIATIIDSGKFACGKNVELFEQTYAQINGVKYCVLLSSGTAALMVALLYYRPVFNNTLQRVFTAPNSFFATGSSVWWFGTHPRFIDVDGSCNIDVKILRNIVRNGDIVLPVSLYGFPPDLKEIRKIENHKFILLDNAQGHLSEIDGKKTVQYADVAIESFYCTKNLGAMGECGCLLTDNEDIYNHALEMRNHGRAKEYNYIHNTCGSNFRSDEIHAAILSIKLKYLNAWTEQRISIANRYRKNLLGSSKVWLPEINHNNKNVYHLFPVFVYGQNRDTVRQKMLEKGIETNCHYPILIPEQKAFEDLGYKKGLWPVAKKQADHVITLPIYPSLTEENCDLVCEVLLSVLSS